MARIVTDRTVTDRARGTVTDRARGGVARFPGRGASAVRRRARSGAHPGAANVPQKRPPARPGLRTLERGRLHTALLLDPQGMLRRTLRQALLGAGVERVLDAGSAAEALRLLSAELVALVLTPWEAPDLAGRPLLHALRNRGRNRNVPVVVLDGGLTPAQVVASVKAGAAGRLTLPASALTVRTLLERIAAETPVDRTADRTADREAATPAAEAAPRMARPARSRSAKR